MTAETSTDLRANWDPMDELVRQAQELDMGYGGSAGISLGGGVGTAYIKPYSALTPEERVQRDKYHQAACDAKQEARDAMEDAEGAAYTVDHDAGIIYAHRTLTWPEARAALEMLPSDDPRKIVADFDMVVYGSIIWVEPEDGDSFASYANEHGIAIYADTVSVGDTDNGFATPEPTMPDPAMRDWP